MRTEMLKIKLLKPGNNTHTAPLQAYRFPEDIEDRGKSVELSGPVFNHGRGNGMRDRNYFCSGRGQDKSIPEPVVFEWEGIPSAGARYRLLISRNRDFKDVQVDVESGKQSFSVKHLYIGTKYFWKVIANGVHGYLGESAVWSFTADASPPRWIEVPGITNVRDIGGWKSGCNKVVRQGLIYRSSAMNKIDSTETVYIREEGRRVLIEELGIRTDLDLRAAVSPMVSGAVVEGSSPVLDTSKVQWIAIPVKDYGKITEKCAMISYREIFYLFSELSNYPIIIHCHGGADRTGTVAFLLHALLGVELCDLIRDYELTSLSNCSTAVRSHKSEQFDSLRKALAKFSEKPDDIKKQVENYLKTAGLSMGEINSIRHILVEKRR